MEKWNAWVWIRWKAGTPTSAGERWQKVEGIKQAWSTQGDWDCCLMLEITDHQKLEEFVWKHVRSNEWVDTTRTLWAKRWW